MFSQRSLRQNLRQLRVANDDTQESLAKELGITTGTLCTKEKGKSQFTLREARYIAKKYNKPIEEIFFDN